MSQDSEERGGLRHTVDKVQDSLGGLVGRVSASGATKANLFVANAVYGDLYEIRSAEIAQRRATSPIVRELADTMFADHMTSAHQLGAALEMSETQGLEPIPKELDTRRQKMIEHLDRAPAGDFDKTYVDQQLLAHEEMLTLLTTYRDSGDNPQLRSLAAGAAPVVGRHVKSLKHVRERLAH